MLQNHRLPQATSDVDFAKLRRQLPYTALLYGSQVVVAPSWELSSRTCSACGWVDADRELD